MNSLDLDNYFGKIIRFSFYFLFIIVPLILTPWNYELFEFNKMLAVYGLTAIILGAWIGRMIVNKKIIFKKTPFDIPLFLFLASQLISSLFSIDRHTSFWGYYSRFHGGLLSTFCYLFLFWAFVSNLNYRATLKTILVILATAIPVAAYGIAEHFGIDAKYWIQDVRTRVFSSLGQPNWLAAYLAVLIPLCLAFFFRSTNDPASNRKIKMVFSGAVYFLFCLCFFYTRSQSGVLGLGVGLLLFWLLLGKNHLKNKSDLKKNYWPYFLLFNFGFLIIFKQVGFDSSPQLNDFFKKFSSKASVQTQNNNQVEKNSPAVIPDAGSPTGEIRKIVWKGALAIWKHYPIFGSGVETFAYSYYNFRPVEHNLVSEWDFLYNKAHNEYLNFLATTGILGLGTYLIFIGSFVIFSLRQNACSLPHFLGKKEAGETIRFRDNEIIILALFSGWCSILITNFFGFSVVPVALFFFLIPAFCVVLSSEETPISPPSSRPASKFSFSPFNSIQKTSLLFLAFFTLYFLFLIFKFWSADAHYAKGEKLNKAGRYDLAYPELIKAIDLKKDEPVYRNEIAESASNLALAYFKQKDASGAANLLQIAIFQSDTALKTSPGNLNFHKGRIKILYVLAQINKDYLPLVINSFQQAIKLAPTDAKLVYNLGTIYGISDKTDLAIASFLKAIELKPNYKEARYALASYYQKAGRLDKAKEELEYLLKYLDPKDGPSRELLREIIGN